MNLANHLRNLASPFLATSSGFLSQQTRNTFVLKRKYPPGLHKKNAPRKVLRGRHYVYELIEDTNIKRRPDLEVILTTYVEGLGNKGDRVSMRPNAAYSKLLLPGLAVYSSPENIEKFKHLDSTKESDSFSSPYVERTMNLLSTRTLVVSLSEKNPWVLERWHVKSAFRHAGFHMQDESITLPDKPISGPDPSIEGKEFFVTVTINNKEQVKVRCRIRHLSQESFNLGLPVDFYKNPSEPIFPEDKPILDEIPTYFTPSKASNF